MLVSHDQLAQKVAALERTCDGQFKVVFDVMRKLMSPPEWGVRPIAGGVADHLAGEPLTYREVSKAARGMPCRVTHPRRDARWRPCPPNPPPPTSRPCARAPCASGPAGTARTLWGHSRTSRSGSVPPLRASTGR